MGKILKEAVSHNYAFWICLIISIVLLVASFILPPTGVIHSSVLAATGELFAFGALGTLAGGIEKGMNARVTKGDVSLEVSKEGLSDKDKDKDNDFEMDDRI